MLSRDSRPKVLVMVRTHLDSLEQYQRRVGRASEPNLNSTSALSFLYVTEMDPSATAISALRPEERPFRMFLEEFIVASAPPQRNRTPWSWQYVDSSIFFSSAIHDLQAGSLVLLESASMFKANNRDSMLKDDTIECDRSDNWMLSSPRLWRLLNHSQPLIIVLNSDGFCEVSWPRTTHHLLYRNTWSSALHQEWLASQEAERINGPSAAWLRSIPFGVTLLGTRHSSAQREIRAISIRPILFNFRGTLSSSKPSRYQLFLATRRQAISVKLEALAANIVGHLPPHPSGVGRYLLDFKGDETGIPQDYYSAKVISYVELLSSSIFTISPPGDVWEAYRTYEAIEAGSIPVIADNSSYKGCAAPALHMLKTIPGVVPVRDWDELPTVLEQASRQITLRQLLLLQWFAHEKRTVRDELLEAAALMRGRLWRAQTACNIVPLLPHEISRQQEVLSGIWRRPQASVDDPWEPGNYFSHQKAISFHGTSGSCSKGGHFSEKCLTPACNPQIARQFICHEARP